MKRYSLFAIALVLFAAACNDATSPTNAGPLAPTKLAVAVSAPVNLPPSPVIDAFLSDGGTAIPVLFFFVGDPQIIGDPNVKIGFIRFLPNADYPDGVLASPDARIMFVQGSFSGRGTLTIGGVTIDLSTASFDGSLFTACEASCGRLLISQGGTQESFNIVPAIIRDAFCGATCQSTGGDEGLITGHE